MNWQGDEMLQIIGWIACLYLVVKGFELLHAAKSQPNADGFAYGGAIISFAGAAIFLWMIHAQFAPATTTSIGYDGNIADLNTIENQANADTAAATKSVDDALNAAEAR